VEVERLFLRDIVLDLRLFVRRILVFVRRIKLLEIGMIILSMVVIGKVFLLVMGVMLMSVMETLFLVIISRHNLFV